MLLQNVQAVLPQTVQKIRVRIDHGQIADISPALCPVPGEEVLDCQGQYLFPGMIDTHTHGASGMSYFIPGADIDRITAFEASIGVTTVAASITGRSEEDTQKNIRQILDAMDRGTCGARIGGIHFEGPFLNVKRKGGMLAEYLLAPDIDRFDGYISSCRGALKIMTISPELPGALDLIRHGVHNGITMSAGHTEATYAEMEKAVDAGLTRMTHTFNAARPLHHREPGVLGAALTDPRVTCEVICDFTHLHPAAVELVYRAKGSARFTAISDSEFCAGLPDGKVVYGGREYDIHDGVAWLPDGTICGSAGNLGLALRHLISLGIPLWEAAEMTASNGAKALRIFDQTGSIEMGKDADLILLDKDFSLQKTFVQGNCVYQAG